MDRQDCWMSGMKFVKRRGPQNRALYGATAASAQELTETITPLSPGHFVLFLGWDAVDVSDDVVFSLAVSLIRRGLAYIVAWGPDCGRVHDLFDDADIQENPRSNASDTDSVIMSTWHEDKPLEEALWFAIHSAYPAAPYDRATVATIAAVIGNAEWGGKVRKYLTDLASLDRAVGV